MKRYIMLLKESSILRGAYVTLHYSKDGDLPDEIPELESSLLQGLMKDVQERLEEMNYHQIIQRKGDIPDSISELVLNEYGNLTAAFYDEGGLLKKVYEWRLSLIELH